MQNLASSEVQQQEPTIVSFRKISKHQTCRAEDRAINSFGTLQPKPRIFAAQFQKIDMQIVEFAILIALGKVEFAPRKRLEII